MKKRTILINLYKLKTPNCGLGQVALNYGKYFKEEGCNLNTNYDVYLLVPAAYVGQFGDKVKYIRATWWRKSFPFLLPKFDLWHATYQLSPFRAFYSSTKTILTIHDYNFLYEKKSPLKIRYYLWKMQNEIKKAYKVIAISEFTKSEIISHSRPTKKIYVIYNGVENIVNNEKVAPHNISDEKPFFFSIGQIKEKKNFHTLIPMMKFFPAINLYIAGQCNSQYAQELMNVVSAENIENVFFIGEVTESEKTWLYRNCKAFLFPSLFEGFGLPVIEALSFGKPVITSDKTSLKEIGGDYVSFWEDFDPSHMKDIVNQSLINFEAKSELITETAAYASTFSYKTHFENYISLYEDCLNEK